MSPLNVKVEVEGLDKLLQALKLAGDDIVTPTSKGISNFLQAARDYAKSIAPVKTGAYRASISYGGNQWTWWLGAGVYYSVFLEFGTRYMAPRATLTTALATYQDELNSFLYAAIDEWMRGRGE